MSNIFAELQRLSGDESDIQETRNQLNEIVDIFRNQPKQDEYVKWFAEQDRQLKAETLHEAKAFFVEEDMPISILPTELQHDSLGFVNGFGLIYAGRIVYPVLDVRGNTAGFIGYDKYELPKYLDSKNIGYKAKEGMFYGMENMTKFYEDGYVVVVEGPVCRLVLLENNINALASLGSYLTPYMITILKRFGHNCIVIPDSDESGSVFRKQIRRYLPKARTYQSTIAKDVDDSRLKNPAFINEIRKIVNNPFATSTSLI